MKKSKPNLTVVNLYLDKTFSTRRELLHEKGQEEYIKMYPCFNSPVMVNVIFISVLLARGKYTFENFLHDKECPRKITSFD